MLGDGSLVDARSHVGDGMEDGAVGEVVCGVGGAAGCGDAGEGGGVGDGGGGRGRRGWILGGVGGRVRGLRG